MVHCLPQSRLGALMPGIAPPQVEVARLGIVRWMRVGRKGGDGDLAAESGDDCRRDVLLNSKDVRRATIEALRPHLVAVARID